MSRARLLPVLAFVGLGLLVTAAPPAQAQSEPAEPSEVAFTVVSIDNVCPDEISQADAKTTMTPSDAICVADVFVVSDPVGLEDVPTVTGSRLVVPSDFVWGTDTLPSTEVGFTATPSESGGTDAEATVAAPEAVTLDLLPGVTLTQTFDPAGEPVEGDDVDAVVTSDGVIKSIEITGAERALTALDGVELRIVEQVPSALAALDDEGESLELDETERTHPLVVEDVTDAVGYRLVPADEATGTVDTVSVSTLSAGGTEIAMAAATVRVEVSATTSPATTFRKKRAEDGEFCPAEITAQMDLVSSMTRFDVLCVNTIGVTVEAKDNLEALSTDRAGELTVPSSFTWTEDNIAGAIASFEVDGEPVIVALRPEVSLVVEFEQPGAVADDAVTDAVVTSAGVTKTIRVNGADSNIQGLSIREQVPSTLRALDAAGAPLPLEGEDRILVLPLDGVTEVSYRVVPAEGANFGIADSEVVSGLVLGTETIASATSTVRVESPAATAQLDAPSTVEGDVDVTIAVSITNAGIAIPGPLELTLTFSEGSNRIAAVSDFGEGQRDGSTITWPIPGGLDATTPITQSVTLDITPGSTDSTVGYQFALGSESAEASIVAAPGSFTIVAPPGDGGVDFSPEQLVRLTAFVIAFALVAVIFGAWNRRSTDVARDAEVEQRYDLLRFQAYTEAILVLVILVAVLVLALNGSLSGESAASLIGVIAGYAFGRSRNNDGGRGGGAGGSPV